MTTIAADATAGIMCSDSYWSNGVEKAPIRKVFRIKGAVVGFAGDLDEIYMVREWMRGPMRREDMPNAENVVALVMSHTGLRVWTAADGFTEVPKRYAIGSGGMAARAALASGVTPSRAVSIARDIDAGTHGKTRTYRLRKGTNAQGG